MKEVIPKDTNGKWVKVKGSGTARTGDYVPLQGMKGPGSANTYFNGYANTKHIEMELMGKTKIFVCVGAICMILVASVACVVLLL